MLFRFVWSLLSSTIAYAYPAYGSFKSLSRRPADEGELERWLMYWSVVGCIVALEHVAEWTISWIPFYWFMKTVFLLWLALPQTQGASYIYQAYLAPFLHDHEPSIDRHLAEFKTRVYKFFQDRLRELWAHITSGVAQHTGVNLNQLDPTAQSDGGTPGLQQPQQPQGPLGQSLLMLVNMANTFGPTLLASMRPQITSSSLDEPIQRSQEPSASSSTQTITRPPAPARRTASESSNRRLDTLRAKQAALLAQIAQLEREEADGSDKDELHGAASEASLDTEARLVRDSGLYEEINADELDEPEGASPSRPSSWWGGWRKSAGYQQLKQE